MGTPDYADALRLIRKHMQPGDTLGMMFMRVAKALEALELCDDVLGVVQEAYKCPDSPIINMARDKARAVLSAPFYGAECPDYPNCSGGCGLGCTHEIEARRIPSVSNGNRPTNRDS